MVKVIYGARHYQLSKLTKIAPPITLDPDAEDNRISKDLVNSITELPSSPILIKTKSANTPVFDSIYLVSSPLTNNHSNKVSIAVSNPICNPNGYKRCSLTTRHSDSSKILKINSKSGLRDEYKAKLNQRYKSEKFVVADGCDINLTPKNSSKMNVSETLQQYNNDGVLNISFKDLSSETILRHNYFVDCQKESRSRQVSTGVQFEVMYASGYLEAIIAIPINEKLEILRNKIINLLKESLVHHKKKTYQAVILTPRRDASWLQRKIKENMIHMDGNYEYVTVKAKKSFSKIVKDCIKLIM